MTTVPPGQALTNNGPVKTVFNLAPPPQDIPPFKVGAVTDITKSAGFRLHF